MATATMRDDLGTGSSLARRRADHALGFGDERLLNDLAAVTEHLFDETSLLLMACKVLSDVRPDCIAQIHTVTGLGGPMMGALVRVFDGRPVPDDGAFRRLYWQGLQRVDRSSVEAGGWVETVRDGVLTHRELEGLMLTALRGWRIHEYACAAVVAGSRIVASLGLLFPGGTPSLSPRDRTRLGALGQRVGPVLRAAALLNAAESGLYAVDHLLAARADTVFLVSQNGHVVGASASGHNLLERSPGVRDVIEKRVRSSPRKSVSFVDANLGLELQISPCSTTGGSPVSIVSVGAPAPSAGRPISGRQAELLRWLAEGLTNRQIAAHMGIAPSTVKTMLESLYRRAGTSGRVKLLAWARAPFVTQFTGE